MFRKGTTDMMEMIEILTTMKVFWLRDLIDTCGYREDIKDNKYDEGTVTLEIQIFYRQ